MLRACLDRKALEASHTQGRNTHTFRIFSKPLLSSSFLKIFAPLHSPSEIGLFLAIAPRKQSSMISNGVISFLPSSILPCTTRSEGWRREASKPGTGLGVSVSEDGARWQYHSTPPSRLFRQGFYVRWQASDLRSGSHSTRRSQPCFTPR